MLFYLLAHNGLPAGSLLLAEASCTSTAMSSERETKHI